MSELKLTTDETRVSYGIGRQLGDQLRENPPPGVNLLAIVAGLSDAFNGTPSRVSQDDLSASFKVIREQMQGPGPGSGRSGRRRWRGLPRRKRQEKPGLPCWPRVCNMKC